MSDKGTIRTLFIDDDIGFREPMRVQFSAAGYAAEVAEDAVEGGRANVERPPATWSCATSACRTWAAWIWWR